MKTLTVLLFIILPGLLHAQEIPRKIATFNIQIDAGLLVQTIVVCMATKTVDLEHKSGYTLGNAFYDTCMTRAGIDSRLFPDKFKTHVVKKYIEVLNKLAAYDEGYRT